MSDLYATRRSRLLDELPDGVGTVVMAPGATFTYFTGLGMSARERPILLVMTRGGDAGMVLPELELDHARGVLGDAVGYHTYDDAPDPLEAARPAFEALAAELDPASDAAAEFRSTRLLDSALFDGSRGRIRDLEPAVRRLRARKAESEIGAMRTAARITDRVLSDAVDDLEAGMTESEVNADIKGRILRSGADDFGVCTVTVGENTARAHADVGDVEIADGDPVMIDTDVVYDGYFSDITRTVAVGDPGPELREVYGVVRRAAREARDEIGVGVPCERIDRAARRVVEDAGYGDAFPHRVGHGIGLEGHEPPYLVEGNDRPLEVGNAFTVEPGIYLEGIGGVRIEDDVVITGDGPEVLTSFPRDLQAL